MSANTQEKKLQKLYQKESKTKPIKLVGKVKFPKIIVWTGTDGTLQPLNPRTKDNPHGLSYRDAQG